MITFLAAFGGVVGVMDNPPFLELLAYKPV